MTPNKNYYCVSIYYGHDYPSLKAYYARRGNARNYAKKRLSSGVPTRATITLVNAVYTPEDGVILEELTRDQ